MHQITSAHVHLTGAVACSPAAPPARDRARPRHHAGARLAAWRLWATAALQGGACACGFGLDINEDIPSQTVQGDLLAHALGQLLRTTPLQSFQPTIDITDVERSRGVPVRHVWFRAATLQILPSSDSCWDFVNTMSLRAASARTDSVLPAVVVATGENPGCVRTFALTPVAGVDLKPYIEEGLSLTVTISAIPPAQDVTFGGQITLYAEF
jgi:hypothetical protein